MGRSASRKPSKPKAPNRPTKAAPPATPLRGGTGDAPAGTSPFANLAAAENAALDPEMARLAVQRPTMLQGLTKWMSRKNADSLRQIAESTLSAAYGHRTAPDAGTDLYARAFQAVDENARARILGALEPREAEIVRTVFGDQPDQPAAATQPSKRLTSQQRAEAAARQALEQLQGELQTQEYFDDDGNPRVAYSRRPEPSAQVVVDRLTPTSFEQLSPEAQKAVARGNELQDAVDDYEKYNPDFLDTDSGQRIAREMQAILDAYPEALAFIDDPTLMSRQTPAYGDAVSVAEGRAALPAQMRLSNVIGGEDRAAMKLATQPERRTGVYRDIPADAPNRRAWIELRDAEEASKAGVTVDTLRRMRRGDGPGKLTNEEKQAAAAGKKPKKQFAQRVEVFLPPTEEISQRTNRGRGGAQADLDYRGPVARPNLSGDVQPSATRPLSDERIAELDAEAEAASQRIAAAGADAPAQPVEDLTTDPDYFLSLRPVEMRPLPGSATGTPKMVKADRDAALRENKSFIEKWREKVFRLANELVDPGKVGVGERGLMLGDDSGVGGAVVGDTIGDDLRSSAISESLGNQEPTRTRASGGGARDSREASPLPLDALVPAWRGHMRFVEGGTIVTRRPSASEVAGFLLDQLDLPDSGMASRLVSHVQMAMNALEGNVPSTTRAKRAAGMVYEPNANYRKVMEKQAASNRQPGDQRPLYDDASEVAARQIAEEARQRYGALDAADETRFVPAGDDYVSAEGDAQPQQQWTLDEEGGSAGADVADAPASSEPTIDDAAAVFGRMRKGGKRGGSSTNIPGLLAMTAAGLAGGSAFADEDRPESPPVEYLAMGRSASRTAGRARAGATGGTTGAPPPNLPPRGSRKGQAAAQQSAAPQAAPAPAPAPTTAATVQPQQTVQPQPQPQPAPKPPMFAKSPTMGVLRNYGPDVFAAGFGAAAAPPVVKYLIKQVGDLQSGLDKYLGNTQAPAPNDANSELNELNDIFQRGGVFDETPDQMKQNAMPMQQTPRAQPLPMPAPNQGTSNSIDMLRQLLTNQRRIA